MAEETDAYHLLANLLRFHATTSDTGGAYSLVESLTAPGAGAPPKGTFEFVIDGSRQHVGSGACVRIPNGAAHAFKNVGEKPGRLLIINSPGRAHDAFFREAGEPMPRGTRDLPSPSGAPDIPRILEIGRKNGLEFLLDGNQGGH
jgi:hypothetical protein